MALSFDVKMCHHEEAHIGGHLLAAIPHGTFADTMHEDRDPIWSHMVVNRPDVKNGSITLPDRPGFGWILDEDFINKYRISYDSQDR
jgi:L-alanine-DL-glutamate epimerase-like enolase superfamily enzyme